MQSHSSLLHGPVSSTTIQVTSSFAAVKIICPENGPDLIPHLPANLLNGCPLPS